MASGDVRTCKCGYLCDRRVKCRICAKEKCPKCGWIHNGMCPTPAEIRASDDTKSGIAGRKEAI